MSASRLVARVFIFFIFAMGISTLGRMLTFVNAENLAKLQGRLSNTNQNDKIDKLGKWWWGGIEVNMNNPASNPKMFFHRWIDRLPKIPVKR